MKFGKFLLRNQRNDRPYVDYNAIKRQLKEGMIREEFITRLEENLKIVDDHFTTEVKNVEEGVRKLEKGDNSNVSFFFYEHVYNFL